MLKVIYKEEPYYNTAFLDSPCTKELNVDFNDDGNLDSIIAEFLKILWYSGFSTIDIERWKDMGYIFVDEGVINDKKQECKNEGENNENNL